MLVYQGPKEITIGADTSVSLDKYRYRYLLNDLELRAFLETHSAKKSQACKRRRHWWNHRISELGGNPLLILEMRKWKTMVASQSVPGLCLRWPWLWAPRLSLFHSQESACQLISDFPDLRIHKKGISLKLSANCKHRQICQNHLVTAGLKGLSQVLHYPGVSLDKIHAWNRYSTWKYFWHPQVFLAMATVVMPSNAFLFFFL